MKKNVMMRIASFLLVAVLISTSAISGTYAKYVTTGSGSDTARVAKWGVQISGMASNLFATTYAKDSTTEIANTVTATEKVVAPGTRNDEGVTFSLTGEPEVAVKIDFVVTKADGTGENGIDVVLPEGTYTDWTQSPYTQTFEADEYHPVVFTLKDGATVLETGTLAEIEAFLEGKSGEYEPGTNLATILGGTSGTYKLTWAWAFGDAEGITGNDKADTLLGNLASGTQAAIANASTSIDFAIAITATQID
ncbi:MAG: hypothetical protein IJB59_06700 [Oscillospiraceae bacterium]|nr:hypothetical protein [Oscillospiraceae bacterium]